MSLAAPTAVAARRMRLRRSPTVRAGQTRLADDPSSQRAAHVHRGGRPRAIERRAEGEQLKDVAMGPRGRARATPSAPSEVIATLATGCAGAGRALEQAARRGRNVDRHPVDEATRASGSLTSSAKACVVLGTPFQASGGETLPPSQL